MRASSTWRSGSITEPSWSTLPSKTRPGNAIERDAHVVADVHLADVALVDVDAEPHLLGLADDDERVGGADRLTHARVHLEHRAGDGRDERHALPARRGAEAERGEAILGGAELRLRLRLLGLRDEHGAIRGGAAGEEAVLAVDLRLRLLEARLRGEVVAARATDLDALERDEHGAAPDLLADDDGDRADATRRSADRRARRGSERSRPCRPR